ncbi:MAG: phosphatidate cytidylyltransferase [Proteobacteria bacterium]|jgi:phosphatidate cytidylyltransferase|nr:phosphatidate cytidylyltransferase [Pseudomonadota bacterium]MDA1352562.1 phosphatidate cytidylyltransferase [Pseudomonadota bacterium]
MLRLRIITALCLVAVFVPALFVMPPMLFSVATIPLVLAAGWEWSRLVKITSLAARLGYLALVALTLAVAAYWLGLPDAFEDERAQQLLLVAVAVWAVIFLWIQGYPSSAILWSTQPVLGLLGLVLLGFTWVAIVTIMNHESGQWLLLLAIVIIALADVGGFFAGKYFGKHKLAPIVSPGKTWEGFFGGLVLQAVLVGSLVWFLSDEMSLLSLSLLVFPVGLYSVLGDLFESMIKRHSGVKDSGRLLPGHGGVLDRIDGVMAALPMFGLILPFTNTF